MLDDATSNYTRHVLSVRDRQRVSRQNDIETVLRTRRTHTHQRIWFLLLHSLLQVTLIQEELRLPTGTERYHGAHDEYFQLIMCITREYVHYHYYYWKCHNQQTINSTGLGLTKCNDQQYLKITILIKSLKIFNNPIEINHSSHTVIQLIADTIF